MLRFAPHAIRLSHFVVGEAAPKARVRRALRERRPAASRPVGEGSVIQSQNRLARFCVILTTRASRALACHSDDGSDATGGRTSAKLSSRRRVPRDYRGSPRRAARRHRRPGTPSDSSAESEKPRRESKTPQRATKQGNLIPPKKRSRGFTRALRRFLCCQRGHRRPGNVQLICTLVHGVCKAGFYPT
jgi:hypothetical protein